jgi:hypothetical protein
MAQTRRMEMQNERAELQMRRGFRPTFMGPRGHIVAPNATIYTVSCGRGPEPDFRVGHAFDSDEDPRLARKSRASYAHARLFQVSDPE